MLLLNVLFLTRIPRDLPTFKPPEAGAWLKSSVLLELLATEISFSPSALDAWIPSMPLRSTVIERSVIPEAMALIPVVALSLMTMFSTVMFGRSSVMAPIIHTEGPYRTTPNPRRIVPADRTLMALAILVATTLWVTGL